MVGARPEELRALRWGEVALVGDPDADPPVPPSISVLRSVRAHGDTKTQKSRCRLRLPLRCVTALGIQQSARNPPPTATDLVFHSAAGTEMDSHNVRRQFRAVVKAAGMDPRGWTPREMRHSFVSVLSANHVPVEDISRLVGHSGTAVTETVYRHQLIPVMQEGATAMDAIFPERTVQSLN